MYSIGDILDDNGTRTSFSSGSTSAGSIHYSTYAPKSLSLFYLFAEGDNISHNNECYVTFLIDNILVLGALRALQEKIRTLEAEKTSTLADCELLRHQLTSMKKDTERESAEVRKAYEALLSEKNVRFSCLSYTSLENHLSLRKT